MSNGQLSGAEETNSEDTVNNNKPRSFVDSVLNNLEFTNDGGLLCHEFVKGNLAEKLELEGTEESKIQYYQQCIRSLDWSFSDNLIRGGNLLPIYIAAMEEMNNFVKNIISAGGITEQEIMREKLPLDSAPFKYAKKVHLNIQEMTKDDEIRVAFQALFLFILRPYIPIKYKSTDSFLEKYHDLRERNATEQDRLRNTANWMDLAFFTIQPRNNKTFILNLIPRIVEGKNARYITGSGQTRPTADRVNLFRMEGNCEKIKRPPRRKKEEILMANAAKIATENRILENQTKQELTNDGKQINGIMSKFYDPNSIPQVPFPPFFVPYYNPGMIPPKEMNKFKNWQYPRPLDARVASFRDQLTESSTADQHKLHENGWFGSSNTPSAPYYSDYMQREGLGYTYDYDRLRIPANYPLPISSFQPQNNTDRIPSSMQSSYYLNQYPNNFAPSQQSSHPMMNNFPYHTSPVFYSRYDGSVNSIGKTSTESDSSDQQNSFSSQQSKRRRNSSSPSLPNENDSNNSSDPAIHKQPALNDGGLDMLLAAAGSMDGQKG